jgi:ribose 5-phosphate isomerase B
MSKVVPIGCDHAGFELKEQLKAYLNAQGYEVKDYGTYSADSTDYPDYAHAVADHVENGDNSLGVLICGSGNGINMTANKHQGIRSALCWKKEIAELARLHNDANIIALPARFISLDEAKEMVDVFLTTVFEGPTHQNRVNKIACV